MKVSMKTIAKELFGTACGVLVILFIGYMFSLWQSSADKQADVTTAQTVPVDPSILLIQQSVLAHKDVISFDTRTMDDGDSGCIFTLTCNNSFARRLGWVNKRGGYFAVVKLTKDGTGLSAWLVQMQGSVATTWRRWEGDTKPLVDTMLEQQYKEAP